MPIHYNISTHQAVAHPAIRIKAAGAGHDNPHLIGIGIEEPLQELLPAGIFVQFVEQGNGRGFGEAIHVEGFDEHRRTGQNLLPVVQIVPVGVAVGVVSAGGGLANLSRTADKRHLPVRGQVFVQHGVIDTGLCIHADHYSRHRKIVKTNLRCFSIWPAQFLGLSEV